MDGYAVSNQNYRIGNMDLYHISDFVMEQDENHRIDISSWFTNMIVLFLF